MKLYFRVLCEEKTRDCKRVFAETSALPCASNFKRMLMIANDLGEMAVAVESNGILYEAIIDPLS